MLLATKRRSDEATKGWGSSLSCLRRLGEPPHLTPPPSRLTPHASCRGSTLVLVVGILALLVIIATTYVTRTHGGRVVGRAIQRAQQRDNNARVIGDMLAQEIADALFPHPVNADLTTGDPEVVAFGRVADSNFARLTPARNPIRYGIDQDAGPDGMPGTGDEDGLPDFPYNFASYHVVPFTNWPDPPGPLGLSPGDWPMGPGNPGGGGSPFLDAEGNLVGNPGFGDTRWLRDIEPLRWDRGVADFLDALSHWRHVTNIARPNNAWRIVRDTSDVTGTLVTELGIPYEQWLAVRPQQALGDPDPIFDPVTGNAVFKQDGFINRWNEWFLDYAAAYKDPQQVPPNFYDLSDLNADDLPLEPGERPEDEFVGPSVVWPAGTPRWNVGRILADTDGDGFTDSFWFLAPTPVEGGIRQIVAVSIIDNGAMLNVNAATRFVLNDANFVAGSKTLGQTPSDLALVGWAPNEPAAVPVGFFDNPANHENPPGPLFGNTRIHYNQAMWSRATTGPPVRPMSHLSELGIMTDFGINPNFSSLLTTQADRLLYWQVAGSRPFGASFGVTPFTLADELELRMFHGQNYPWIVSRFERAVQAEVRREFASTPGDSPQFLHANWVRKESSEYLDQLSNRELLADNRRKLTMYNGARNDLMPPWLWWRWPSGLVGPAEDNFFAQARTKLDLREPDGISLLAGERSFAKRLAPSLLLALTDGDDNRGFGYFGEYTSPGDPTLEDARRAAAAYAANILAWRDEDARAQLVDDPATQQIEGAIKLPEIGMLTEDPRTRFLGMERQPFLLEAFIAHVYPTFTIPPGYLNSGERVVLATNEGGERASSTVVVVQLANPFDEPIALDDPNVDYEVRVFGQPPVSLRRVAAAAGIPELLPATADQPRTLILYSIESGANFTFLEKWLDFLDLELTDHPHSGTVIFDVRTLPGGGPWSANRDDYAPGAGVPGQAIELVRLETPILGSPTVRVVIDRADREAPDPEDDFRRAVVVDMNADVPVAAIPQVPQDPPVLYEPVEWWFENDPTNTHWVEWVRFTRAWGFDANGVNNPPSGDPGERNPRYVFANSKTVRSSDPDPAPPNIFHGGDKFKLLDDPDRRWFPRSYERADAPSTFPAPPPHSRKPTFFDMNPLDPMDPTGGTAWPDKGFYPPELNFPMQMLQKDDDFEQVGELLNVWMFGHELEYTPGTPGSYVSTRQTFSEFMFEAADPADPEIARVNRLRIAPIDVMIGGNNVTVSPVIGVVDPPNVFGLRHAYPALPAGLRVLDAFVCDDGGPLRDFNDDGTIDNTDRAIQAARRFRNANAFSGRVTPGLININTATPEVMRSLPHMSRLVHEINSPSNNPFVRLPEAIVHYREGFNGGFMVTEAATTGIPDGANYSDRSADPGVDELDELRPERGFASTGEVMLLTKPAAGSSGLLDREEAWQVDFAGEDPYGGGDPAWVSTDVQGIFDPISNSDEPDEVAGDLEERNLLFAGISNLITTRSDVFTVYFKVRSFRQNPVTGVWDATDREYIVDESRYVMLVDRSQVNRPTDKPRILYLERLPK